MTNTNRKQIDLLLQVLALVLPWAYFTLFPDEYRLFHLEHIVVAYEAIGFVIVGSAVYSRVYMPMGIRAGTRGWFETAIVFLAGVVIISLFMKSLLLALLLLLYAVPLLVLWYLVITVAELVKLYKRKDED